MKLFQTVQDMQEQLKQVHETALQLAAEKEDRQHNINVILYIFTISILHSRPEKTKYPINFPKNCKLMKFRSLNFTYQLLSFPRLY